MSECNGIRRCSERLAVLRSLSTNLRGQNIDSYAVAEFIQGNQTRRWAVGWSFGPMRPVTTNSEGTIISGLEEEPATDHRSRSDRNPRCEASVPSLLSRITDTLGSVELVSWRNQGKLSAGPWAGQPEHVGKSVEEKAEVWEDSARRALGSNGLRNVQIWFPALGPCWTGQGQRRLRWTEGHDQAAL